MDPGSIGAGEYIQLALADALGFMAFDNSEIDAHATGSVLSVSAAF